MSAQASRAVRQIATVGVTGTLLYGSRHLILLPVLAAGLGIEAYGRWELLLSAVPLATLGLLLGLGMAFVRFFGGERARDRDALRQLVGFHVLVLGLGALWVTAAWIWADPLAQRLFGEGHLAGVLRLASVLPLVGALDELCIAYLQARQVMGVRAAFLLIEVVALTGGAWWWLRAGLGLSGVLGWSIIVKTIVWIAKLAWIAPGLSAPSFARLGRSLAFGASMVAGSCCYLLIGLSARAALNERLGASAVGLFGAGALLGGLVLIAVAPIEYALFPVLAGRWNAGDREGVGAWAGATIRYTLLAAAGMAVLLSVGAPAWLRLMVPESFGAAAVVVPWVALGSAAYGSSLCLERIVSFEHPTRVVWLYGTALGVGLAGNAWCIPRWGLAGAGMSVCAAFLAYSLLVWRAASSVVRVDWRTIVMGRRGPRSGALVQPERQPDAEQPVLAR